MCDLRAWFFYYLEVEKAKAGQNASAKTEDGGKLKEAATKKVDESILIQIADRDLALKVKYHKQCYEKYMCKRFPQLVFHRVTKVMKQE